MAWKLLALMMLATLLLSACISPATVPPPEVVDTWRPPEGVEATPPLSCEEIGGLFAYDAAAPLDIQAEKSWHEDGVTITYFNYASPRGGRVPAALFVPDGAGPFAGMVFMHGSGGDRYSLRWLASAYARLGVVGITIGAPSSRPAHGDLNFIIFREQDAREQIQLIVDLRRAVDILVARPNVDPQRLAYLGISYGGAMGGLMAGVEHRLQGYVLQVGDGGLVTHFSGSRIMGLPEQVRRDWLAAMWPIESLHYVGCAAPAALLFQNGTLDTMVPPADALRYQRAGSEPKTIRWYEADHGLNGEAYQDQAGWLRERIGIASYRMAYPFSLRIALIAWFLLTLVSLAVVIVALWRTRPAPRGARLLWLLTTALLGPLGLAAYWISTAEIASLRPAILRLYFVPLTQSVPDSARNDVPASPARRALGSAAWAAVGNVSGAIIFLALILLLPIAWHGGNFIGIAEVALMSFCVGWLVFAAARWLSRFDGRFAAAYRRPVLAEVASTCLVCAAAFVVVNTLIMRVFGNWALFGFDLTYGPLWGSFSLAALAGTLVTYPLHLWLLGRGVIRWGG